MVTSARAGDGKSLTAYALADSFATSGHRVALVTRSCDEYGELPVVKIPGEEASKVSREQLAAFIEKIRAEYDFAIIDAETFANTGTMPLVRLVDGILLTVRIGRTPTEDDEAMVGMIEQFGGRIVGVVATEANTIAEFERSRRNKPLPKLRPNAEQNPARSFMTMAAQRLFR